jgi:hypothetical protein
MEAWNARPDSDTALNGRLPDKTAPVAIWGGLPIVFYCKFSILTSFNASGPSQCCQDQILTDSRLVGRDYDCSKRIKENLGQPACRRGVPAVVEESGKGGDGLGPTRHEILDRGMASHVSCPSSLGLHIGNLTASCLLAVEGSQSQNPTVGHTSSLETPSRSTRPRRVVDTRTCRMIDGSACADRGTWPWMSSKYPFEPFGRARRICHGATRQERFKKTCRQLT